MFDLSAYVHVPVCQNAVEDDLHFNTFKTDGRFTTILEHTQVSYSHDFMNKIIAEYGTYLNKIDWDLVKENDSIGSPYTTEYQELSDHVSLNNYIFSPSTVAYVYKALDILSHIKNSKLDNVAILEIGAGYGGQCKMILDLCKLFDINIKSYTMVDLHWPNKLQEKYLNTLGHFDKIKFISFEELRDNEKQLEEFDYLISIYALAEFTKDIQQFYIDKMVDFPYHYLVWNSPSVHHRFSTSEIINEQPRTGPHNVLIKSKVN